MKKKREWPKAKELLFSDVGTEKEKLDGRKLLCMASALLATVDYILQMTNLVTIDTTRVLGLYSFSGTMKAAYLWNKKIKVSDGN